MNKNIVFIFALAFALIPGISAEAGELPSQVLSPVEGPIKVITTIGKCPAVGAEPGTWCYNQHKGSGHNGKVGIGGADDTYAWDINLNTPVYDYDNGMPVRAVAPGNVSDNFGTRINVDKNGVSYGQVLIEHSYPSKWWSGYLHLKNIQVSAGQNVTTDDIIGYISDVSKDPTITPHLHLAFYNGSNTYKGLVSFNAQIEPRGDFIPENPDISIINPPSLISPGSSSEPGEIIDSLTPVFQWESVPDAQSYSLYISKYPYGEDNLVFNSDKDVSGSSVTETSLQLPLSLQYGVMYRWNMKVHSASDSSRISNTLYFQTGASSQNAEVDAVLDEPQQSRETEDIGMDDIQTKVILTLYVHSGSADGPIITGANVRGMDGSGNSFDETTDSNGYVEIQGDGGTWIFSALADGYEANNWQQEITETDTKDAFLQKTESDFETDLSDDVGTNITALKDEDPSVRIRAINFLAESADARAVIGLIEVLNDENSDVRMQAVIALGEIDDERAVGPLSYTSVKDADYYVRERAKIVLQVSTVGGNLEDGRSAEPIIEALKDQDPDVRIRAAEALGQIKNAAAVDPLIEALNDGNSDVRLKAAWALGEIDDEKIVDPLSYTSVKDADYYVRVQAKTSLEVITVGGNIEDGRSAAPIIEALIDQDSDVRIRAAEALGQIKNATAVDPLIEALNDGNSDVRFKAAWALGEIDDESAVDPLSYTSIKDADYYVRGQAKTSLEVITVGGNIEDGRSAAPIIGALIDQDSDVRIRAAEALGQIKNSTAVGALMQALNDENADVRLKAAWALGEIGDESAVDSLNYTSVNDADYYVREEAKSAIEKIGV